jgi:S-adenosylmethionine decarboxylase proenzyme
MICLEPGLFLQVEELENGPKPFPLESGFSKNRAYRALGLYNPAETSDAYFVLSNDRDEIWFICNRHLRTVGLMPQESSLRTSHPLKPRLHCDALPLPEKVNGIHLFAEWYGCDFSMPALQSAKSIRDICLVATRDSGLVCVGDVFHQFEPQGVTGTVLLSESHLAIHTWPESGFVTLDVYVCNYLSDNTQKALTLYKLLKNYFNPKRENQNRISRGFQDE